MLIIPNQKCDYKNKQYEPGICYDVSVACAKKLVSDKKAKKITGGPITVTARVPKIVNRDPVIEHDRLSI